MTVQDNSPQAINTVLIAMQKEIDALKERIKELENKLKEK